MTAYASLLRVRGLAVRFPTERGLLHAVNSVDFDLHAGRSLGVVGESGSGKSVLARALMNLLPRTAQVDGEMLYHGQDLRALAASGAKHFWGAEMALVMQDPMSSLHPAKKIGEQVAEVLRYHMGRSRRDAKSEALELLEQTGVPDPRVRAAQYPHELSGGLCQRAAIAIAIACRPRLLIADEPTTALDATVQKQLLDLLGRLCAERGMALILITHDLGVARRAGEVMVMYAGRVVEQAETAVLFEGMRHPYTEALFDSLPSISHRSHRRFDPIPGLPAEQIDPSDACPFAPRCRYTQPDCVQSLPPFQWEDESHRFACGYPVGIRRATVAVTSGGVEANEEVEARRGVEVESGRAIGTRATGRMGDIVALDAAGDAGDVGAAGAAGAAGDSGITAAAEPSWQEG